MSSGAAVRALCSPSNSSICPKPDCNAWKSTIINQEGLELLGCTVRPNPDISGIGVIIGFLGSACLTFLVVSIYYALGCYATAQSKFLNCLPNKVDQSLVLFIWKNKAPNISRHRRESLEHAVLAFSDLQAVTGLAILACGFSQLHCSISAYHWQVVVYTAWFASVSHMTTLTALQHYFVVGDYRIRALRITIMFCIISLLTIALVPTGNIFWLQDYAGNVNDFAPAICYFHKAGHYSISSGPAISFIISVVILWTSFFTRLCKLFPRWSGHARRSLRSWPGEQLKRVIRWSLQAPRRRCSLMIHHFFATQLIVLRSCFDLYTSMFWEMQWLLCALGWGALRLFTIWPKPYLHEETFWGFSQTMAVFLMFLPAISFSEDFMESKQEDLNRSPSLSDNSSAIPSSNSLTAVTDEIDAAMYQSTWRLRGLINILVMEFIIYMLILSGVAANYLRRDYKTENTSTGSILLFAPVVHGAFGYWLSWQIICIEGYSFVLLACTFHRESITKLLRRCHIGPPIERNGRVISNILLFLVAWALGAYRMFRLYQNMFKGEDEYVHEGFRRV